MSGRKDYPITITSSQWENMRQAVTTAESRATNAEQNTRRAESDAQGRLTDLQNRCNQQVAGLERELQNQSRNHSEALNRAERDFNQRLHQQGVTFQEALRQQSIEFERELRNSHENLQTQLNNITQRMEAEQQNQAKIASYWINQAQSLLNEIDSKYRHRLFIPREWDMLNMELRSAQDDLNRQNEAALATARRICFQAVDLRDRVFASEWEWTQLYNYANSKLVGVKNRIESLNSLQYIEQEDGKQVSVLAEVDFWTNNSLTAASQEQQRLENIIRTRDNLSLEQLRSFVEQISILNNRISEIDVSARDNYCASQVRREIGAELIDKLPGWNIDEVLFESEDERENLHLIFRQINGIDRLSLIIRGGSQNNTNVTADYFCDSHNSGERHDEYVRQVNQAVQFVDPNSQPRVALNYARQTSGDRRVLNVEEIKIKKPQTQ